MRKLLNVLYVTSPDAYLTRDAENVVVRLGEVETKRVPVHILEGIVCFGYTGASPALMALCAERGVTMSFLTPNGKFLARVEGPVSGNVLLRRKQYRTADNPELSASIAATCVLGKVANCRSVLRRALRDHGDKVDTAALTAAVDRMANQLNRLKTCHDVDVVRGIEGEAAQLYFSCFSNLVLEDKESFSLSGRSRRPPLDNMNALLSFLYTLLAHEARSALETVGLDPAVGYLHRDRPGRPSLALDIMEELRPVLADRLALSLINRKQIRANGFSKDESGGVTMNKETRDEVLVAWQKRKREEIIHPYLNEKIPVGLIPYVQALLLARYLRGDIDGYPVFLWK
ncbi:type I-C CRISPR-associated endonuclease Cas1c [Syntrophomonas palmitatica]|uniref:type I-C CRISPR-associated endonuclease Cas1c n=1 Tax=Syntrophomonas palmitatica TaxID=402877 RepID=UPI0006D25AF3|nr:type I-C CRISPR-associated endonuclease Cas1c [Syntrophomonas palmitatica]